MVLSPQQIAHYQAFGFVIIRQVLTPAEQQQLHAEIEQRLDAMYTHRPFDGSERHWSGPMMGDETPFMQGLTEDERFVGVAEQLYGEDVLLAGCDANRYTGPTAWHPVRLSLRGRREQTLKPRESA